MATRKHIPPTERFWPKVLITEGCWLWLGCKVGGGYGRFWDGICYVMAHRWAYEDRFGKVPTGLQLDHLCRIRRCVRPDHLEPVTAKENIRRGETGLKGKSKTHCPRQHEYNSGNTYIGLRGGRKCRTCRRTRWQKKK